MDDLKSWFLDYSNINENKLVVDEFSVDGIVTRVHAGDSFMSSAIANLLGNFTVSEKQQKAHIDFYLTSTGKAIDFSLTPNDSALVADAGFLKFYKHGSRRYLHVESNIWAVADLDNNTAYAVLDKKACDTEWVVAHLAFFPVWVQLLKSHSLFSLHAAGVIINGKTFVFPAATGSGKSTLSVILASQGYKLLSDDTLLLSRSSGSVSATGFPESINLRMDAYDTFPELIRSNNTLLNEQRMRIQLDAAKEYPGCYENRGKPDFILFPNFNKLDNSLLLPASKRDAHERLIRSSIFFMDPTSSAKHFQVLAELVSQCECYTLQAGRDRADLVGVLEALAEPNRSFNG
jgi:hypothetical protein